MFYYIEGKLTVKTETFAVIDAGGVGYRIFSTRASLDDLGEVGSRAKLYIYTNIKSASDIFTLYGFSTQEEKNIFEMILSVSGVGAKTAASLLSNISPSKFAMCVVTNDSKYLAKNTPGLGPKGAQRIILELKDKFKDADISGMPADEMFAPDIDGDNEAVSALIVLGYSKDEAMRALSGATGSTEEMIKYGLKHLAR